MSRKTGANAKVTALSKEGGVTTSAIVYRGESPTSTVVGYWMFDGEDSRFVVLSRHTSRGAALNKINALNGGSGNVFDKDGNIINGKAAVAV